MPHGRFVAISAEWLHTAQVSDSILYNYRRTLPDVHGAEETKRSATQRAALRWAEIPGASRVLDHKTRLGAKRLRRTPPNDAARAKDLLQDTRRGRISSSPE
jgi:hypothetical protein